MKKIIIKSLFFIMIAAYANAQENVRTRVVLDKAIKHSDVLYPAVIDNFKLNDVYDKAMWYIYLNDCLDTACASVIRKENVIKRRFLRKKEVNYNILVDRDTNSKMTFGELPLEFRGLEFKDSVEYFGHIYKKVGVFKFVFKNKGEPIFSKCGEEGYLDAGICDVMGMDLERMKGVYLDCNDNTKQTCPFFQNDFLINDEIKNYINKNWDKLTPTFKRLAKKHGW